MKYITILHIQLGFVILVGRKHVWQTKNKFMAVEVANVIKASLEAAGQDGWEVCEVEGPK